MASARRRPRSAPEKLEEAARGHPRASTHLAFRPLDRSIRVDCGSKMDRIGQDQAWRVVIGASKGLSGVDDAAEAERRVGLGRPLHSHPLPANGQPGDPTRWGFRPKRLCGVAGHFHADNCWLYRDIDRVLGCGIANPVTKEMALPLFQFCSAIV